jgi:hypothetical protein
MSSIKHHKAPILLVLAVISSHMLLAGLSYAEIYKAVDEKGKTTFSDKPSPTAVEVEVRELNTTEATTITFKPKFTKKITAPASYNVVKITSPENNAVIANGLVGFSVSTQIMPALQKGHRIQLIIDGSVHSTSQGNFTVNSINRGEHQLQVIIIDEEGTPLTTSKTVKLFAHRPSSAKIDAHRAIILKIQSDRSKESNVLGQEQLAGKASTLAQPLNCTPADILGNVPMFHLLQLIG